jgi:hypothetical protein
MARSISTPLFWTAAIIVVTALVPIVAMTLMVAAVVWIPILVALVIGAAAFAIRSRRQPQ